jgi:sn-2 palmitoyl-lipid 9-desaturase
MRSSRGPLPVVMNTAELETQSPDVAPPPEVAVQATASGLAALELPEAVQPLQVAWGYTFALISIHLLSLLALLPYYFSWTGLVLALVGQLYGLFGITLCYHRLLTHQGFTCPKWFEHLIAIIGVCCLQDTPARWVAVHRMHHQHSDRRPDPHSPLVNFLWAHMGWVMVRHRVHSNVVVFEQYARDILRDPFYFRLERNLAWFWVYAIHAVAYYFAGLAIGWLASGKFSDGVQLGSSVLVWGVFVRTVAVWHCTWAVNSVTHVWGYRNYDTGDDSRNHWLVAFVAHGEGWHNNHHADQRAAAHGHRWWEIDPTYCVIHMLELVGLVRNVVRPRAWREERGPSGKPAIHSS